MGISKQQQAEILVEALPYIWKYSGKIVVVKYGGNAMVSKELQQAVMRDLILMRQNGVQVVLVHGGGPEITKMLSRVGKQSEFVGGLRVTDRETAEIAEMVLAGKINKTLVNLLQSCGGKAVGLSGMDGDLIQAEMKDPALGYVGRITKIQPGPVIDLLKMGYIPVIATMGCDHGGNFYNINADTAAAALAGALGAECLLTLTDIAGVLRDKDDPESLIPQVTVPQVAELTAAGIIAGGMIPKLDSCVEAIRQGVKKVFILDGRVAHAILLELLTDHGFGTMVTEG